MHSAISMRIQAINSGYADTSFLRQGPYVLKELCSRNRMLPSEHILTNPLTDLGEKALDSGGFGTVRKGMYSERFVAIKIAKVDQWCGEAEKNNLTKVIFQAMFLIRQTNSSSFSNFAKRLSH
jgi:hypothetical protein